MNQSSLGQGISTGKITTGKEKGDGFSNFSGELCLQICRLRMICIIILLRSTGFILLKNETCYIVQDSDSSDYFKTVSTPTRSSWFETATRNHCELVSMKF
ncbi:hypothetical protein T4B_11063 [Trichinella pseudospiralis]|uniref:Uncharacterized protein n=1 Tax=Trichinella pseudospiralis TaxID=6337 RepID=A0A0V1GR97_TRIPS|nr:hypothetical protein T4B_11063 [Trichinella pseudospiralis]